MNWSHLPCQQQRGTQYKRDGAPEEAIEERSAQGHKYADLDVSRSGEPQRGIDYPATDPEDREGDITPTLPDETPPAWAEVVQPEDRDRQARPDAETAAAAADHGQSDLPLPEGK